MPTVSVSGEIFPSAALPTLAIYQRVAFLVLPQSMCSIFWNRCDTEVDGIHDISCYTRQIDEEWIV